MNMHEIFDKVATHLIEQGVRCVFPMRQGGGPPYCCRYRYKDLSCAVGCLIDDRRYHDDIEGNSANEPVVLEALRGSGILAGDKSYDDLAKINLLLDLQCIHDSGQPHEWPKRLRAAADKHGIDWTNVGVLL